MRTQYICLVLAIVLICPYASAQWIHTSWPDSLPVSCFAVSGANLFAGAAGVFMSTDNGTNWTTVSEGLPKGGRDFYPVILSLASSGTNLFAAAVSRLSGSPGGVFLSTNSGANWIKLTDRSATALAVSGTNIFAGGEGIFLSTDNGTNWIAANNGLPKSHLDSTRYVTITCLVSSGQNLFAGTYESGDSDTGGVFLSTNSGSNWTKMNAGLQVDWGVLGARALAVSGTNLFAGTIRGIFLSTNNGTSWIATNPALHNNSVSALAVCGTNIFAGTGYYLKANSPIGVFLSTDSGANWTAVNEGLPRGPDWDPSEYAGIRCFALVGQSLFAGTDNGVWRRPLSEMITSVEPTISALPGEFFLSQNYPNPFNPSTTIKYELPKASMVRLSVYDILGREVSVLVNERKEVGVHEVKFDGSNLASGIYFYRLQAGDVIQSKRMMILK